MSSPVDNRSHALKAIDYWALAIFYFFVAGDSTISNMLDIYFSRRLQMFMATVMISRRLAISVVGDKDRSRWRQKIASVRWASVYDLACYAVPLDYKCSCESHCSSPCPETRAIGRARINTHAESSARAKNRPCQHYCQPYNRTCQIGTSLSQMLVRITFAFITLLYPVLS